MAAPRWTMAALAPPSAMRLAVGGIWMRPGMGPTVIPWSNGTMTVRRVFRSTILSSRIFLPIIPFFPPIPGPVLPVGAPDPEQLVEVRRAVRVLQRLLVLHRPRCDQLREAPVDSHQFLDVRLHHGAQEMDLPLADAVSRPEGVAHPLPCQDAPAPGRTPEEALREDHLEAFRQLRPHLGMLPRGEGVDDSVPTSRWCPFGFLCRCVYSIGASIVMMFAFFSRLIVSTILARVVVLP